MGALNVYQTRIYMHFQAECIRAAGMTAENSQREISGESPAYVADDFERIAANIENLAHELIQAG